MPQKKSRSYPPARPSTSQSRYYRQLRAERQKSNHNCPILRLPNELLIDIILSAAIDNPHDFLALSTLSRRFHAIVSDEHIQARYVDSWFSRNQVGEVVEFILRYARQNPAWVGYSPDIHIPVPARYSGWTRYGIRLIDLTPDVGGLQYALPWSKARMRRHRARLEGTAQDMKRIPRGSKKTPKEGKRDLGRSWLLRRLRPEASTEEQRWRMEDVVLGFWLVKARELAWTTVTNNSSVNGRRNRPSPADPPSRVSRRHPSKGPGQKTKLGFRDTVAHRRREFFRYWGCQAEPEPGGTNLPYYYLPYFHSRYY
ncbi:hypothetical protein BJ508DRAFT_302139 [Ascobolus immersus RN42]|uniref:F-box domain-containing protein n=1 Tax=Ascobolus immersus RN42 TaxID=1160509 RepID=A0A3N4IJA9_ASCIM|nr:hypothetical protein BJ508DRAFT_302139 [Ascobolus immersus RN42]